MDSIDRTNPVTAQVLVTTEFDDVITAISEPRNTVIQVYPNPAQGILTIRSTSPHPLSGRLMNASGQVVREKIATGTAELSVQHLPTGLYFLHLTDKKGKRSIHKILIP